MSVPSWPSTMSLPSPGSHWNTSLPAPMKATSLPCWPSMKSLPSPPRSRSMPLLPRIVSLPAPPSTVILISAARLPVAENLSLPPLALRTRFSLVPMSMLNGAGVEAVEPHAGAVGRRGELLPSPLPPLTSTVSMPAPPSFRSVSSPGFQIIRSLPRLAEHLVVGVAAGERVVLGCRRRGSRTRPCRAACRCRPGRRACRRRNRR